MISVIVPVKNGLEYTRALVESVQRQNPGAAVEWIIVDSGSTDGTPEFCAGIGARVVPFPRQPFNYCAAIDAGAAAASGELWIISNNDVELRSRGDLGRIERVFREWPLLAVLSPGRPEGSAELELVEAGVNGATWAVRPEAFHRWGGMPESLSGYGYDEAYTAVQCWRHGWGIGLLTGWDALHHGSATFGPASGNTRAALRRNLSRLLAVLDAADLDRGGDPERILWRLYHREQRRAPCRLAGVGGSEGWRRRQGCANTRRAAAAEPGTPVLLARGPEPDGAQWLPWLVNELLLQPGAASVGARGWVAARAAPAGRPLGVAERRRLTEQARAVGPPPPPLMPRRAWKRATLRERAAAWLHDWRRRGVRLPEGW